MPPWLRPVRGKRQIRRRSPPRVGAEGAGRPRTCIYRGGNDIPIRYACCRRYELRARTVCICRSADVPVGTDGPRRREKLCSRGFGGGRPSAAPRARDRVADLRYAGEAGLADGSAEIKYLSIGVRVREI